MSEQETLVSGLEPPDVGDFWSDIISVAVNVADVAVKVLPLILSREAGGSPEFVNVGPLRFGSQISGNSLVPFVENIGPTEYSLVLNEPGDNEQAQLVLMQPSGSFGSYHVFDNDEFGRYADGAMTAAPANPQQAAVEGFETKILAASVGAIGLSVAAQIFPGFSVAMNKRAQGSYFFTFEKQDTFVLKKVEATAQDPQGNKATVKVNPEKLATSDIAISVDLPEGVRPDPSYALFCEIEVDVSTYQKMLAM